MGMQQADICFSDDSFNDIGLCRRCSRGPSCLPRVRSICHCITISVSSSGSSMEYEMQHNA